MPTPSFLTFAWSVPSFTGHERRYLSRRRPLLAALRKKHAHVRAVRPRGHA